MDCSAGRQIIPGMSWSPPWAKGAIPDTVQGSTGAAKATVALQECKSLQINNKSVSITGVTSLQSSGHLKFSTPSFLYLLREWTLLKSMNSLGNAKTPLLEWLFSPTAKGNSTDFLPCHLLLILLYHPGYVIPAKTSQVPFMLSFPVPHVITALPNSLIFL